MADVIGGGTPDTTEPTYWGGNILWFTPTEVGLNKYVTHSNRTITNEGLKQSNAKLLPAGSVLLSSRATIGECSITINQCTTNQGFQSLVPKDMRSSEFLYYLALSLKLHFIKHASGSTFLEISNSEVKNTPCFIPQLIEQQKIGNFLSLLDKQIELYRKHINTIKSYKRGVKNKFFDDFNNGWKEVPLSAILTERKTYCEKDGTYTHATLSKEGVSAKTERYDRDYLVSSDDKKYKITHYGDICYNPANLKFGVICLNTFGDAIFSPIYVTFEVNAQYDTFFIGECVTRANFINKALQFQQGTVYERMAVSPEDLLSMTIKIPSLAEQTRIAKCLRNYDLLIEKHDAILTNLVSMKKSLLSQLFI